MKRKKLTALLATVLSVSVLSACTGVNSKIAFKNYWNENSIIPTTEIDETLVYDVTFEKSASAFQSAFTMQYTNGTYTTHLVSKTIEGKAAYEYTTTLDIDVSYTFGENTTEPMHDRVETKTKFYAVDNALRPHSSEKTVVSHSPSGNVPTKLEDCYAYTSYTIKTTYNDTCTNGTTTITANPLTEGQEPTVGAPSTFEIETDTHSYLDNEQLLLAIRAIPEMTSTSVLVYSPFSKAVQTINLGFTTEETARTFTYSWKGAEASAKTVVCRAVNIAIDSQNSGETQTAYYAKMTNPENNTNRSVMMRLETPIAYSMGKLIYTLKSANYA